MRLSQYFLPILREAPSDAVLTSHKLMNRAGLIRLSSAGIYVWLPLGLRVLQKISAIIRDEQNKAGAIELLMPTIQSADLWQKSGRYEDYGQEMLRMEDRSKRAMLYGPTNEEMITQIFAQETHSWRDCGKILYHIQWKFRDEIRPRFGVLRGREFLMKDGYSFDLNQEQAQLNYYKMFISYLNIFARLGLQAIPVRANTGPIGGDLSHEFIMLAEHGESELYFHKSLIELEAPLDVDYQSDLSALVKQWTDFYAAEGTRHDGELFKSQVKQADQIATKGIEIGHIFYFGDKYSRLFDGVVTDKQGKNQFLHCGSYGIGISRLVGAIIEAHHDEDGIIWPEPIAPFIIGLVNLTPHDEASTALCEGLYRDFIALGVEVLYDDRDERSGVKFAQMDLIGLPWQMVVGSKGLKQDLVEIRERQRKDEAHHIKSADAITYFMALLDDRGSNPARANRHPIWKPEQS